MSATPTRRYSAGPGARPGFHRQGTESPVGYGERIDRVRRMSGSGNMLFPTGMGPSRMSPGPSDFSRRTPSRNTPNSGVFRPVAQHQLMASSYSPVTVTRQGFAHGASPGPLSPRGRYGASPARTFEWGYPGNYPAPQQPPQMMGGQQAGGQGGPPTASTADVIAAQSQDYVDENLAAFQVFRHSLLIYHQKLKLNLNTSSCSSLLYCFCFRLR